MQLTLERRAMNKMMQCLCTLLCLATVQSIPMDLMAFLQLLPSIDMMENHKINDVFNENPGNSKLAVETESLEQIVGGVLEGEQREQELDELGEQREQDLEEQEEQDEQGEQEEQEEISLSPFNRIIGGVQEGDQREQKLGEEQGERGEQGKHENAEEQGEQEEQKQHEEQEEQGEPEEPSLSAFTRVIDELTWFKHFFGHTLEQPEEKKNTSGAMLSLLRDF